MRAYGAHLFGLSMLKPTFRRTGIGHKGGQGLVDLVGNGRSQRVGNTATRQTQHLRARMLQLTLCLSMGCHIHAHKENVASP